MFAEGWRTVRRGISPVLFSRPTPLFASIVCHREASWRGEIRPRLACPQAPGPLRGHTATPGHAVGVEQGCTGLMLTLPIASRSGNKTRFAVDVTDAVSVAADSHAAMHYMATR